jgi:hypothetical protein
MGYRGRLIWPCQARIERLDTSATKANAIASQPSGYDRIFREPVKTATTDARVYLSPVAVACQVRTESGPHDKQVQLPGGRELEYKIKLTLHYRELELAGLLKPNGTAIFQPSDRLQSIYKTDGVTLLRDFSTFPLYCVHVQDRSWGLDDLSRNLVMLYFDDRREGAR